MAHCAATQLAIENGLDHVAPEAGVTLLDDWIEQLNGVDKPGASGVAKDLERLKTKLGKGTRRSAAVLRIVHKLGAATTKLAAKAAGANASKLRQPGEALTSAGQEHADEEAEAAA